MEINRILSQMCRNNKNLTDKVMAYAKENINRFSHEDSYVFAYIHVHIC